VARRSHKLNPEPAQVEHHRVQHIDVGLAGVAPAGTDLAQLERPPEEPPHLLIQGLGQLQRFARQEQVLSAADGQSILLREPNAALRAHRNATAAEQAFPEVHSEILRAGRNGIRRAGFLARAAGVRAPGAIQHRQPAQPVGQHGFALGKGNRSVTLPPAGQNRVQHLITSKRLRSAGGPGSLNLGSRF